MTDWHSVPTFGTPNDRLLYVIRPSAYGLILGPLNRLAIVHTATGSYLPGGGSDVAESPEATVCREAREECGLTLSLGAWRRAAIDHVTADREGTHFEKRSTFCGATVLGAPAAASERDHQLTWLTPTEAVAVLTPPSHRWSVTEWLADHAPLSCDDDRPVIHKSAVCVVRHGAHGPELLVFRHPVAGTQLPKGSVEPGERPEDAARRELEEESGIVTTAEVAEVGRHVFEVGAGPSEDGPRELHLWHTFLVAAGERLRHEWVHEATGGGAEQGLRFEYFWLPIAEARRVMATRYQPSIDCAARACASAPYPR
jgi:8-oxo-dGTP pyrophosphatase MutT (NUDIX family)